MVKLSHVSFSYKDKQVLKDISIHLRAGECYALIGANGAGKTTMLKLIASELLFSEGEIMFFGTSVHHSLPNEIKKKIGFTRELSGIYLKMTGFEYLNLIGSLYNLKKDFLRRRIMELAERFHLSDSMSVYISKYSAGMKKKLEFISSVLHEPELLFLDEPFESVDNAAITEIKAYLNLHKSSGGSCIICSHIHSILEEICNKCIILKDGVLLYDEKLLSNKKDNLLDYNVKEVVQYV